MELDDEVCLCFHVTQRKLINYLRVEQPERVAQLSECGGAGTGCGWCRPVLERLFRQYRNPGSTEAMPLPEAAEYARQREAYRRRQAT
jgi:NAD(P)H-nitrite reductase large subunit